MPQQYVATDHRTGVEVAVTGEFPPDPEDRVRIARTATLFTRLMSTLLEKPETERRQGFRAVETQLELAEALIRQDTDAIRRLVRETMENMGITRDQLDQMARQVRGLGGFPDVDLAGGLESLFGEPSPDELPPTAPPPDDTPPQDSGAPPPG